MNSFPKIELERLTLSELNFEDVPIIVKHASNENVSNTTLNIPHPYSPKDAIFWINLANQGFKEGSNLVFAIRLKPDLQFIGGISLGVTQKFKRAELGYWLAEEYWNKGYVTEAAQALVSYGFEKLDLNKITSSYITSNPASGKVMQKCGLTQEGELKEHFLKNGVYHDVILTGLTKKEFEKVS